MRRVSKAKREKNRRVSEKISVLVREGKNQRQAEAMALSMERSHRLGRHGVYHRVGKRRTKRKARRTGRR